MSTNLTTTNHVSYPHEAGYLYDCPACESQCHCTPGSAECVYHSDAPEPVATIAKATFDQTSLPDRCANCGTSQRPLDTRVIDWRTDYLCTPCVESYDWSTDWDYEAANARCRATYRHA